MHAFDIAGTPRASPSAPPLWSLRSVRVRLGALEVGPFSFDVHAGERVVVLGPSGAGKSTLLRLLTGELPPDSGVVEFGGRRLSAWSVAALARRRAVLPQAHEVAFGLQAGLVVALGRSASGDERDLEPNVRRAAALARAEHLLSRRFDRLSGGERARVHLARVFAQLDDVRDGALLVDEPLAALDPGLQLELLGRIDGFARERNLAVISVMHDLNHALAAGSRWWLLSQGQWVADVAAGTDALPALESLYRVRLHALELPGHGPVIATLGTEVA